MNKKLDNTILLFLFLTFFLIFKFNTIVKISILNSCLLWFKTLVPSMFAMYLMIDLLLNYGFANYLYKIFKSNIPILIIISLLLGTPANAKYIKDFYVNGYIGENEAKYILAFAYSPNPLFILSMAPNTKHAIATLTFLYITNIIIAYIFKKIYIHYESIPKHFDVKPFSECLEKSIYKTFKILVLVLGIVIFFGIINSFINIIFQDRGIFIKSILEMTNAVNSIISANGKNYKWIIFAVSFGGLSIHTQIKSILDDTPISYKYFLYGRLIASLLALIIILFY